MNRIFQISKAVYGKYYEDLANTDILDDVTMEEMKIKVTPHEGIHEKKEYMITLKFKDNDWPLVFVDSELFDKIKTPQYKQNKGKVGSHKGICIKRLGHGYAFHTNFKELCDNKWENYIYYLISVFNNIQDFEKGIGFKSNYKEILDIE